MQNSKQLQYQPDPNKFDLRTHVWNTQGELVKKNLYRTFITGDQKYYERPVNSGNLWYENNQPAGRVELKFNDKGHIISKEFDHTAPHKEYTPPLTGAEKLHFELEQERARTKQLEAELAAIKKDHQPLSAVQEGFPAQDSQIGEGDKRKRKG